MNETVNPATGETPLPETGDAIITDESIHACAPFCPTCRQRLMAAGTMSFQYARVDREGWHHGDDGSGDDYEEHTNEVYLECVNDACGAQWRQYQPEFCDGSYDECAKPRDIPWVVVGPSPHLASCQRCGDASIASEDAGRRGGHEGGCYEAREL